MTGFVDAKLSDLIEELGEERVKSFLSDFSCPINPDVEQFLVEKAVLFSKQHLSETYLVFASFRENPVLVGYYTIAPKYLHVKNMDGLSSQWKKRIRRFARLNTDINAYIFSAPLIGQLGKNYKYSEFGLISGDELLKMACDKIKRVHSIMGGQVAYLECEDVPKLREFYERNGFVCFQKRELERDEVDTLKGDYLLQYLADLSNKK